MTKLPLMGREQRKNPRRAVSTPGIVFGTDGRPIVGCQLRDVSATGAQIILDKEATLPQRFVLPMSRDGKVRRQCALVWQFSIMVGAQFALNTEHAPPER